MAYRNNLTCQLVNYQYCTTNYANDTNYITISISVIREIRSSLMVHIIKFNVQTSILKVQCSKFKGIIKIRVIREIRSSLLVVYELTGLRVNKLLASMNIAGSSNHNYEF